MKRTRKEILFMCHNVSKKKIELQLCFLNNSQEVEFMRWLKHSSSLVQYHRVQECNWFHSLWNRKSKEMRNEAISRMMGRIP